MCIIYFVTRLSHLKVTKINVDFIRQWRMIFFYLVKLDMMGRVYIFGLTTDRLWHTVSLLLGWFFCGFCCFCCEFGCFLGGDGL